MCVKSVLIFLIFLINNENLMNCLTTNDGLSVGTTGLQQNRFKSVPTTVKTYENDTVLLPCYHNTPYLYVRWLRDDQLLADSRHPEFVPPERTKMWTNGSLQVSNLKSDDTGEYYCNIMTTGGLATQIHAIEVQYPPSVISSPQGIVELQIGTIFEIICEAKGVPHPIITWRQQGQDTSDNLENNRRLLVEVTNRTMAGPIECVAINGVGEPAVAGIVLIVLFAPEVKTPNNIVHIKIGMRAVLSCDVISAPHATVHWFHRGSPILINNRFTRHDTELNTNKTVLHYYTNTRHMLIIKNVRDVDLGTYECRAENKIGFKGVNIELSGKPMSSIFKTSPMASTPMTHNLIWQTESLSPIIEYKLKFRQIPSGNITPHSRLTHIEWNDLTIPAEFSEGPIHTIGYTLRGLLPASVYEVAVISRNRYGWSDVSRVVRFATGGEVEVQNYSTETIEYDQFEENYITDLSPPGLYDNEPQPTFSSAIKINCFYKIIIICIFYHQLV